MKLLPIGVAGSLALSACAWEPLPATVAGATIGTIPDPAARVMLQCDRLGFSRYSDGHRLCVMRGVDRLAILPAQRAAPITILPHGPYPPLYPSGPNVTVVPLR